VTRPQTLGGTLGLMLFAIIVWVAGPLVTESTVFEWSRTAERMLTGANLAILMTAVEYARVPVENRLAPHHAIGLGGFNFALVAMMAAERNGPFTVLSAVGLIFLASPGMYLIVSGIRRRKTELPDSARR